MTKLGCRFSIARKRSLEKDIRGLYSDDAETRKLSALRLSHCHADKVEDILVMALDDDVPMVRRAAASSLGWLKRASGKWRGRMSANSVAGRLGNKPRFIEQDGWKSCSGDA